MNKELFNSFIQWNLQSYRTKFTNLKVLLNKYQPICVALQETRIKNRSVKPPTQYNIIKSNITRQDDHERGVAILIHKSYNYETIPLNTTLQACAAKIYVDNMYTVCSIYLPHEQVRKHQIIRIIEQLPRPFLIMGDMNARSPLWGDTVRNEKGTLFEEIMLETDVIIMNNGNPTHYHSQTNTHSVIDLTICSPDCQIDFAYEVIDNLYDSDHYPVQIKFIGNNVIPAKIEKFNINKANWTDFQKLTLIDTQEIENIEIATEHITNKIIAAAELSIPRVKSNIRRPPMAWWNKECDDAKRERAERAVKSNPNQYNKIRYNYAKAKCRLIFNRSRRESWEKYVGGINYKTNIREVWTKVRKLRGKYNINSIPVVYDRNGQLQTEPKRVANTMAQHFAAVSQNNSNETFTRYKAQVENRILNLEGNNEVYNQEVTVQEFNHAIATANESSPGPDEITYSMIKQAHPTLQRQILQLYNKILSRRQFPSLWQVSIIVPIRKESEEDFKRCKNYRPIALTNCLCKILEKIINIRIMWFLDTNKIISPYPSGFRENRSCLDHIVQLENTVRQEIANKRHTIAVFFDIQKAYDTAWKHYIIMKLHQYGMRGHILFFIKIFLNNRRIMVKVNDQHSDLVQQEEGIPQGSVLGCTCFLIAINEIAGNLPPTVQKTIYVDDFSVYSSGRIYK